MSIQTEIDCDCCGNKILLTGLNRTLTGIEFYGGYCMKCGYVTYGDFVSSDQVNEWREKDPFYEDLKQIDELYLHTNRYKKVPTKEKMLELGWFKEEEIEKWIDFHNSSQCSKSLPWDFSVHKGNLNREYGKLKRIQEYEELKEEGEKINDQRGLKVLEESYKDVLEGVS